MGLVWIFFRKIPLWVYPAVLLAGWAGCSNYQAHTAKAKLAKAYSQSAVQHAKEEAQFRGVEQQLVEGAGRVSNELSKTQAQLTADRRAVAERLRSSAQAWAASQASSGSASACRSPGAPAVGVLSDATRADLVEFAADAEAVRLQLLACQSLLVDNRKVLNSLKP